MSKVNNLTDFLTDVANAIRIKKGTEELINPQNFSSEILSIPSGGGGDGTLPITVDVISGLTYTDGILSWTAGDYSELIEEYNASISYQILINNIVVLETTNLSVDISAKLEIGINTVSVKSKSIIAVSPTQFNLALSSAVSIEVSNTYLNIKDNFTIDLSSSNYSYNEDFTAIEMNKRPSGTTYATLAYIGDTSDYSKICFEFVKCAGANQPEIALMYSTNGSTWNTLETIKTPYYELASYEKALPSGTKKFKFYVNFISSNYDPSVTIQNIRFK